MKTRKEVVEEALRDNPRLREIYYRQWPLPWELTVRVSEGLWPAPGCEDTELGVFMGPEVSHGETKVYAGVQA